MIASNFKLSKGMPALNSLLGLDVPMPNPILNKDISTLNFMLGQGRSHTQFYIKLNPTCLKLSV